MHIHISLFTTTFLPKYGHGRNIASSISSVMWTSCFPSCRSRSIFSRENIGIPSIMWAIRRSMKLLRFLLPMTRVERLFFRKTVLMIVRLLPCWLVAAARRLRTICPTCFVPLRLFPIISWCWPAHRALRPTTMRNTWARRK